MAVHQHASATFRCPDCGDVVVLEYGTWHCEGCGYVPKHGAD